MTKNELIENITEAVAGVLITGNSAPKVYVRVRPNGTADVSEETSWTCSQEEYFKQLPHTLSLEILQSTRDYSHLSEMEIEECADNAQEEAEDLVNEWMPRIEEWIEAGNFAMAGAA